MTEIARRSRRFVPRLLVTALLLAMLFVGFGSPPSDTRSPSLAFAAGQPPNGLQVALQMESLLTAAIAETEKSVVAIARIRKDNQVFDGSRVAPPRNRIVTPTDPNFVPDYFASGVVVDAKGLILTNYHALGDPDKHDYWVWIQRKPYKVSGVKVVGKVVAGDPWTDLAVLKIDANDLTPMRMGDAQQLRKGQIVISLGNPYAIARDGQVSASWGIVSNLLRHAPAKAKSLTEGPAKDTLHQYGTLIQTDARLNLGTSGGALVNLRGEMVGLTTSLAALTGYESAAGFAIPVDATFRRVLTTLTAGKRPDFGFLGLAPTALGPTERRLGRWGAYVSQVVAGTPAHKAGIKAGDIITHVNDVPIYDPGDLSREIGKLAALAQVRMKLVRGRTPDSMGRPRTLQFALSKQFVELQGPAYSTSVDPQWRGLQVDYATAVPPSILRERNHLIDPKGCVSVRQVERDSAAWKAGLREGDFVSHVNSQRISSPLQFFEVVARLEGNVTLQTTSDGGSRKTVSP